nr:hypothetical protein [Brevibacterium daeguense]
MVKSAMVNAGVGRAAGMAFQDDGSLNPKAEGAVQRLLSVQRPVVLAYVRRLRRRHPGASPADLAEIVRSHYLNLTTGSGAAVGATAMVPGIGTTAAIGVAAVETAGFLEGSALYAQAVAELHGLPVRDPVRANALVMGLMLGTSGRDLVKKFSDQASGKGPSMMSDWGSAVTKQIPSSMLGTLTKRMRRMLVKKYAVRVGGSYVGRVLPFGIGAVIGGFANRAMAKAVVEHARTAFGPFPAYFEEELDPQVSTPRRDLTLVGGLKNLRRLQKQRQGEKKQRRVAKKQRRNAKRKGRSAESGAGEVGVSGDSKHERPRTYRPDIRL